MSETYCPEVHAVGSLAKAVAVPESPEMFNVAVVAEYNGEVTLTLPVVELIVETVAVGEEIVLVKSPLPDTESPVALIVPPTSNALVGFVFPIPTKPDSLIIKRVVVADE
jgi:hypothetical protein